MLEFKTMSSTIYHIEPLLGCAEVVHGGDLGVLGAGGGLKWNLGLSEVVSNEADAASFVALHVQEHGGSWFNFGVTNCGIFNLAQDNSGELRRCGPA